MGMTREERVKAYVEQHPGSNAQDVAEALGLHRSGVSADLNRLYRKGILVKQGKRPVRFYPAGSEPGNSCPVEADDQEMPRRGRQPDQDGEPLPAALQEPGGGKHKDAHNGSVFGCIIGSNGSIKAQIQLAKAAVAYPPYGLHTLITGETGVGKSLLAEAMWRYSVSIEAFGSSKHGRTPPFVVFSCAEYADNPQLLLAQLFGYVKGAFTGANENRPGLVERAQGGILFLDEIHRLPPTGQELLFRLIDKGQFRRIGEMQDRSANLMIIGATTETPSSVLLSAFRRRIPVHVELPRLAERPVSERLSLIAHFLLQEANRLGLPVQISGGALKMFMCFDCVANIGDLKNTLQLCCAKGYLSLLSDSQPGEALAEPEKGEDAGRVLKINIEDVPQRVYERMQNMEVLQDPRLSSVFNHVFCIRSYTR
ncbi:MAG TPA: sigma 54-interacting transcriptional regulator [Firmicutes bacterium]|nr:sigma 54-interacting transcriptional regulator [Candidatus Fermentithermobacillaceae bacterium]